MSFWTRLFECLQSIRTDLENWLRPVDPTSTVDFSIAFIGLAARLAKADGRVPLSEVVTFRRIMEIPPEEVENAARVYNLCREAAAGYEYYARQIRRLIQGHPNEEEIRTNPIDGLFHIALADGEYQLEEDRFLREVAGILEMGERGFEQLRAWHVLDAWRANRVLGVDRGAPADKIRDAWRRLVRQNHPDLLISKGLPPEMIRIAEARVKDINRAYEELAHG